MNNLMCLKRQLMSFGLPGTVCRTTSRGLPLFPDRDTHSHGPDGQPSVTIDSVSPPLADIVGWCAVVSGKCPIMVEINTRFRLQDRATIQISLLLIPDTYIHT